MLWLVICSLLSLVPVWCCSAVANFEPQPPMFLQAHFKILPTRAFILRPPFQSSRVYFEASIPDGVVGLQADPLGDGPVLLLGLGQLLLGAERLVGLSQELARRGHGMLGVRNRRSGTYRHLDGVVWMSL